MKNITHIIICIFLLCYGNYNAQNYIEVSSANKEKYTNKLLPQHDPMSHWQSDWSKESVIAINKIIKEYGLPNEYSLNRIHWIIPGKIKRTITYTENFWFFLSFDTISSNKEITILITENDQY